MAAMKRYFITGTDTDCGKTYATLQLLDSLPRAKAIKPVASGCVWDGSSWVNSDAQLLQTQTKLSLDVINPWSFKLAVSPHIAAKAEGRTLSVQALTEYCLNLELPETEILLIEGAGGLLVPLNDEETWVDFLIQTQIPVILIVGLKVGCINHALLTQAALKMAGIPCAGWIANCLHPNMLEPEASIETLKKMIQAPLLARIPYLGTLKEFNLRPMLHFSS